MTKSEQIDEHIAHYSDWRGELLAKLRKLIHQADPEITEEWKWGVPVFNHNGLVCGISGFKTHVKFNLFQGAHIQDSHKLFNSGLGSKDHRSINFSETDKLDELKLKALIQEAVAYNTKKGGDK